MKVNVSQCECVDPLANPRIMPIKLFNRFNLQIDEVDRGLLKFINLEQLSLTGNSLTEIPGSHLPRSLSVKIFISVYFMYTSCILHVYVMYINSHLA